MAMQDICVLLVRRTPTLRRLFVMLLGCTLLLLPSLPTGRAEGNGRGHAGTSLEQRFRIRGITDTRDSRRLQSAPPATLPVSYYPSSSNPNGFTLTKGNLVGIVALPSAYTIAFDLMRDSDYAGTGDRSILHLTTTGGDESRLPGVWFCDVRNCPTAAIEVFYNSVASSSHNFQTPVALATWTSFLIAIDTVNQVVVAEYTGSGGTATFSFVSGGQTTFPSVQVFASDSMWITPDARIRNLAISPPAALPVSYYPSSSNGFTLSQGNLVGIVTLPSAYTLSFDLYLSTIPTECTNIVHLSADGTNIAKAGSRIPGVRFCNDIIGSYYWFGGGVDGCLLIGPASQVPTSTWVTVTVFVDLLAQTITMGAGTATGALFPAVSKAIAVSQTSWPSVQVYACDPWHASPAGASIRNLVIAPPAALPVNYYPSTSLPNGFTLAQGNLVGIVALPSVYTVSFDLYPTADGSDWRNIVQLSSNGQSRLPNFEFCKPSDGGIAANCPTLGVGLAYTGTAAYTGMQDWMGTTQALPRNAWSTVTSTIDTINQLMTLTVSGAVTISNMTMVLTQARITHTTCPSVMVYASNDWQSAAAAEIRNLAISLPVSSRGPVMQLDAATYSGSGNWVDSVSGLQFVPYNGVTYSSSIGGGSFSFTPASAQYMQSTASLPVMTTWSIEVWLLYTGVTTGGMPAIVADIENQLYCNFELGSSPFGTGPLDILAAYDKNNVWYTSGTTTLPNVGEWFNIIASFDGTYAKIYVNNELKVASNIAGTPQSGGVGIRLMRRWDYSDFFGGSLGLVRIFSVALTAAEINANWLASMNRFGRYSATPTPRPSSVSSQLPSPTPSATPTRLPSPSPTTPPSPSPSVVPTNLPTAKPSASPSVAPTSLPSPSPSSAPSVLPTVRPTQPTAQPSPSPTALPSTAPSPSPSSAPSPAPSSPSPAPSPEPTGQPTRQPSRQPTVQPSRQPSVQPTSGPCKPGFFNAGSIDATVCTPCPLGTFASDKGSQACQRCAISSYSSVLGATVCQDCPRGEITNFAGSSSVDQCLSPSRNFIMGGIALALATGISIVYVILGGFKYTAFIRRERVVIPQAVEYQKFSRELRESDANMAAFLRNSKIRGKILAALTTSEKKEKKALQGEGASQIWVYIEESAKLLLFTCLAICIMVIAVTVIFALLLAKVFFNALIVWKQNHNFSHVPDYQGVMSGLMTMVLDIFQGCPKELLWPLSMLFEGISKLFEILSQFKIDWRTVGVTCAGASSPFQLLLDLFILGMVIVIIESELQNFRGLCFADTLERYAMRLLSREYRKFALMQGPELQFFELVAWYSWYACQLLGLAALHGLLFVINFQSALTFLMALVQVRVFAANKGLHAFSETCIKSEGWKNFDTYLAHGSSFIAYSLILPVAYELSKILCPKEEPSVEKTLNEKRNASVKFSSQRHVDRPSHALASRRTRAAHVGDGKGISGLLWHLPPSAWPRLFVVVFSPDLLLAHLTRGLLSLLRVKVQAFETVNQSSPLQQSPMHPPQPEVTAKVSNSARTSGLRENRSRASATMIIHRLSAFRKRV